MTTRFTLFTLNYPKFKPEMGVPVRTSNGYPRFVRYDMPHSVAEIMPDRKTIHMTDERSFRERYWEKLADAGVDVIASRFRAIVAATGDEKLVLMCFEDLSKPGAFCHRTAFAEWWEKQTGEVVTELGASGPPPREATLFD